MAGDPLALAIEGPSGGLTDSAHHLAIVPEEKHGNRKVGSCAGSGKYFRGNFYKAVRILRFRSTCAEPPLNGFPSTTTASSWALTKAITLDLDGSPGVLAYL